MKYEHDQDPNRPRSNGLGCARAVFFIYLWMILTLSCLCVVFVLTKLGGM